MEKIFKIYEKSNLIIQSFKLEEILNKGDKYQKKASELPLEWQEANESNIDIDKNGHFLLTGRKIINDKYVIGLDIDNKEDTTKCKNGLIYWEKLIRENNYTITTPCQASPNKGFHYLFLVNSEKFKYITKNIRGVKINGVKYSWDVRAIGGCLYTEPTNYTSIKTNEKKYYKWIIKPKLKNFQEIPDFLYEIIYNHQNKQNIITNPNPTKIKKITNTITDEISIEERELNNQNALNSKIITQDPVKDIPQEYIDLINLLNKDRFIDTVLWINIGILFKSLDIPYSLYSKLSKENFEEYEDEICLQYWNSYRKKNWDINILKKIAKIDSPEEYKKISRRVIENPNDYYENKNSIKIKNKYFNIVMEALKNYDDIIIQSDPGTGKTTYISSYFKQLKENNKEIRIMTIIPQTCLINQHYKSFSEKGINLLNYQETNKLINNDFTICINSLCKIISISDEELKNYVVFIDEVDSFIKNLTTNQTLNNDLKLIMILLKRILKKCYKCVYASAHVKNNLKYILDENRKSVFYVNDYRKQKGTKAYEMNDINIMSSKMLENIKNNEYFLAAFDSITLATKMYNIAYKTIEDKSKILLITSETNVKIVDASKEFENKFIYYSPSISYGVDVTIANSPQDVFVFGKGLSIDPYILYQQTTRTRIIRDVYYYIESINNTLKYESLEDATEKIKSQITTNALLTNLFCNIDENFEPVLSCGKFFELYCWEKYHNNVYMYDMKKTYEHILEEQGFEIIKDTNVEKKLDPVLNKKLKKEIETNNKIIIDEYINGDENIREQEKYKNIHERAQLLKIDKLKKKEIEVFKEFIKTDKGITNHTNIIRLLKTDEYIKSKILKFKENSMEVKVLGDVHNKIALLRKIEKDNDIQNLDVDFEENDKAVEMTDETFKLLKTLFSTVKKKPTNRHELKIFYVSMIRHLSSDMITKTTSNKRIDGKPKKITKYSLNDEKIKLSLNVDKYSNKERKNFNDIIKKFENIT
jgi:hypothetical protein